MTDRAARGKSDSGVTYAYITRQEYAVICGICGKSSGTFSINEREALYRVSGDGFRPVAGVLLCPYCAEEEDAWAVLESAGAV